jgi:hypothetical protein
MNEGFHSEKSKAIRWFCQLSPHKHRISPLFCFLPRWVVMKSNTFSIFRAIPHCYISYLHRIFGYRVQSSCVLAVPNFKKQLAAC